MFGLLGSSATLLTPRCDPKLELNVNVAVPLTMFTFEAFRSVHVAAAVRRLPEPDAGRLRVERHAAAVHRRNTVHRAGRAHVDRVAVRDDRADRPERELRRPDRAGPRVAAVVGVPDAAPGAGVTRRVRLAGARPQAARVLVVVQVAEVVRAERPGDECPGRGDRERVVGAPDAAARGADPQPALHARAGGLDRHRGRPAGRRCCGPAEGQRLGELRLRRADVRPGRRARRAGGEALRLDRAERLDGGQLLGLRDRRSRVRALAVLLLRPRDRVLLELLRHAPARDGRALGELHGHPARQLSAARRGGLARRIGQQCADRAGCDREHRDRGEHEPPLVSQSHVPPSYGRARTAADRSSERRGCQSSTQACPTPFEAVLQPGLDLGVEASPFTGSGSREPLTQVLGDPQEIPIGVLFGHARQDSSTNQAGGQPVISRLRVDRRSPRSLISPG